ncbi:MAG TPA: hypothetical protein VJV79_31735 [Polyangiaceae bacterium]|nr:hypothetical protein [Polyangiaceae bacterium]
MIFPRDLVTAINPQGPGFGLPFSLWLHVLCKHRFDRGACRAALEALIAARERSELLLDERALFPTTTGWQLELRQMSRPGWRAVLDIDIADLDGVGELLQLGVRTDDVHALRELGRELPEEVLDVLSGGSTCSLRLSIGEIGAPLSSPICRRSKSS